LVQSAHEKPTGDGEREPLLVKALELEDAINSRASTITLDDAEFASDNGQDAVEISDSDADEQEIQARIETTQ